MSAPIAATPKPAASALPALPRARNTADTLIPYVSVLYVGTPKSGKSTCALSWPDPLVLDFGSNLAALQGSHDLPYLKGTDIAADSTGIITRLERIIIPAIANGRVGEITDKPIRTIVFEDLACLLGEHLDKVVRGAKESLNGFDDYGTFGHKAENLILKMVNLTYAGFNVVATIHLGERGGEDIRQKIDGKWEITGQKPIKRRPIVSGQFRDIICGRFDNALLTQRHLTKKLQKNAAGVIETVDVAEYYVYTINPDSTYEGIGQGLGREGGKFNPLPPKVDGRYPALAKAWGLDTK